MVFGLHCIECPAGVSGFADVRTGRSLQTHYRGYYGFLGAFSGFFKTPCGREAAPRQRHFLWRLFVPRVIDESGNLSGMRGLILGVAGGLAWLALVGVTLLADHREEGPQIQNNLAPRQ